MINSSQEIKNIFQKINLEDCKGLIESRRRLIYINKQLMYYFHFIQSSGIFITTISQSYESKYLIWLGIGLNVLASLLRAYESMNQEIIKKATVDLSHIKNNAYANAYANENNMIIDIESPIEQNNFLATGGLEAENLANSNQNHTILSDNISKTEELNKNSL
jgi:hypothetical protein